MSGDERSIIDYVLINKEYRKEIKNVRLKKGAKIHGNHNLIKVITELSAKVKDLQNTSPGKMKKCMRTYTLRD